jgi:NAD(P)H dehydrogenase (quinone)
MIVVTGATGQLGRLVIQLCEAAWPRSRSSPPYAPRPRRPTWPRWACRCARPTTPAPPRWPPPSRAPNVLLLVSSSEVGQRLPQHRAVIDAAREARVGSARLHQPAARRQLAAGPGRRARRPPKRYRRVSGLPHVLLRNGWYTENYLASVARRCSTAPSSAAAGAGRIASAARADYAAAAAAVLAQPVGSNRSYELAGDTSYMLAELVAELNRQTGRAVVYQDLPQQAFEAALVGAGLPAPFAALLADSDAGAAKGALFDDGHQLGTLIGRPTTPLAVAMKAALAKA